ncbi:hypothetical protein CLF_108466 [Clonorchis sinensis]|uniref:Uncharacterized protein n=1 Tax=Clonorchis sinensis TaxID=79923 RepID=G7YRM8_CLOSI|nr:hypothetical protein CLF_108466 [Clonorchis sinensis]
MSGFVFFAIFVTGFHNTEHTTRFSAPSAPTDLSLETSSLEKRTNQKDQCKCFALIGVLEVKLELLSQALEDTNTKKSATWKKVDEEFCSLNEYLALSIPGLLAARKGMQLSDAAEKIATTSIVDRGVMESRLIVWGHSPEKSCQRSRQSRSLVVSLLSSTTNGFTQTGYIGSQANLSTTKGTDAVEGASLTWAERAKHAELAALFSITDDKVATLLAGDSGVPRNTKERRPQPNKRREIRQIRKLLTDFLVQSTTKTNLVDERQAVNGKNKTDPGKLSESPIRCISPLNIVDPYRFTSVKISLPILSTSTAPTGALMAFMYGEVRQPKIHVAMAESRPPYEFLWLARSSLCSYFFPTKCVTRSHKTPTVHLIYAETPN